MLENLLNDNTVVVKLRLNYVVAQKHIFCFEYLKVIRWYIRVYTFGRVITQLYITLQLLL